MMRLEKEQWQQVIDEFYKPFSKWPRLNPKWKKSDQDEPAGFDCEVCGGRW